MRNEIKEYYEIVPQICTTIDKTGSEKATKKYTVILLSSLKLAFEAVLAGENQKAHDIYNRICQWLI
jgi:hypothetical protein